MQGRSWMAALTLTTNALLGLILGLGLPVASRADDSKTTPTPAPAAPATAAAPSKVVLDVRIDGLGPAGCDVEVAPGSSDCHFRPVSQHIAQQNGFFPERIPLNDVRTTGADRYCIFSITIREPGQPVKTIRRGMRLAALSSDRQDTTQFLYCYLSSPSKLAKAAEMRDRR